MENMLARYHHNVITMVRLVAITTWLNNLFHNCQQVSLNEKCAKTKKSYHLLSSSLATKNRCYLAQAPIFQPFV
jgi:hypothetical protein